MVSAGESWIGVCVSLTCQADISISQKICRDGSQDLILNSVWLQLVLLLFALYGSYDKKCLLLSWEASFCLTEPWICPVTKKTTQN